MGSTTRPLGRPLLRGGGEVRVDLGKYQAVCHRGRGSSPEDEAAGSSPARPTTGPDQRKRQSAPREFAGRDGWRIKNSYLVTVARHEPNGHEPPLSHGPERVDVSLPRCCVGAPTLCSCGSAKACRTALGRAQQPPPHDLQACGSETSRRRSHETLSILGPMRPRRSTNTARRTWPRGLISRPQQGHQGSRGELLGVVLGSLGRGIQADGVWVHLPATAGPIVAVPARGCHRQG